MKLIIDISEEAYNGIKMGMRNRDDMREVGEAIENGTPLDKIREKIQQASYEHYFEYGEYIGEDTRKKRIINTNKVLQIIDKYMEGSEE